MLNQNEVTHDIKRTPKFMELLPDFRRFIARKPNAIKAITHINYDGTYINVTDAHRAIRFRGDIINNEEAPEEVYNYDIHTDEYMPEDFPKMDRLYPHRDDFVADIYVTFDKLKEMREAVDITTKQARDCDYSNRDGKQIIYVEFKDGMINVMTHREERDRNIVDYTPDIHTIDVSAHNYGHAEASLYINGRYLRETLTTVSKMRRYVNTGGINLKYVSAMRPLLITDSVFYEALIMPVRNY